MKGGRPGGAGGGRRSSTPASCLWSFIPPRVTSKRGTREKRVRGSASRASPLLGVAAFRGRRKGGTSGQSGSVPSPRNERARGGVANEGAERPRERPRPERASGGGSERVSRQKNVEGAKPPTTYVPKPRPPWRGATAGSSQAGVGGGGPPTAEHGAGTPCDCPRQSGGACQGAIHKRKYICASGSALVGMTKQRLSSAGTRDTDPMTWEIIGKRSTATKQVNRRI